MTERFARLRPLLGAALMLGVGSTAALALDPTPKWCEGVKIAAFPGGPQGGVFANNVYNGFRQAELDLGPEVTYYFSDWDPNKMLTQIQQAVATGVDGIATYGFAGEAATGPVVKQAYEQGIIFTTLNTALPDSEKAYAPQGFGFVGAPNYDAGFALATEAAGGQISSRATRSSSGASRARAATAASAPSASSTPSRRSVPRSSTRRSTRPPTPTRTPALRPSSA